MLAQVGQLDVHACPQPSTQVGWASEDVAQVRVPHELIILRLEQSFNLKAGEGKLSEGEPGCKPRRTPGDVDSDLPPTHEKALGVGTRPDLGEASAESGEHFLHVAPLLHGDDPQVVLLVDPYQEGLIVVVPGGRAWSSQSLGQNMALDRIQKDTAGVDLKQRAAQITEVFVPARCGSVGVTKTPTLATLEEGREAGAPHHPNHLSRVTWQARV